MHSKARLKKLKMVGCWRIDVELYKNFYTKLGVQIWTTPVQFWSEIILVISNQTRAARSFDFEITHMISDQIALQSVQLP